MGHSLQPKGSKSPDEQKMWLFYWFCFMLCHWAFYYFEWLFHIPFYFVSFILDIYYEVQIIALILLVSPKLLFIQTLRELCLDRFTSGDAKKTAEGVVGKLKDWAGPLMVSIQSQIQ